jgi:hypothetical protein
MAPRSFRKPPKASGKFAESAGEIDEANGKFSNPLPEAGGMVPEAETKRGG